MDLLLPCNSSISLHWKPGFHRTRYSFASETYTALRCYRQTTSSELQMPMGATGTSGCCTSCAVKSGQIRQPEALGISAELKSEGYALLCVGFPSSDMEVETQDEDEVYWLQFGRYFARGPIERDDYALELAMGDE